MPSWVVSERVEPQPIVRRASAHDLPRIVELLQQESLGGEPREDPGPPLPQAYYDAFAAIEAEPDNDVFVAEVDGRIEGTFQLTVTQYLHHIGERVALIESVVIDEPARGVGIGSAMMREAIEEARRRGCRRVELMSNNVRADAHRFYERLGFVPSHIGMKLVIAYDA